MKNGQLLDNAAVASAQILATRQVPGAYGNTVQGTLYRVRSEGGYAVQIVHRLPSGCCRKDAPVFFHTIETAEKSLAFALQS